MAKRRRQDSLRASWLARNSSNGIGLFLVQSPPGDRKSGMPHSVEMPAPVKGTIVSASWTSSVRWAMAVSRSGAIIGNSNRTTRTELLEPAVQSDCHSRASYSVGPVIHIHERPAEEDGPHIVRPAE